MSTAQKYTVRTAIENAADPKLDLELAMLQRQPPAVRGETEDDGAEARRGAVGCLMRGQLG